MGGHEHFKHAREMGVGCGWTRIRRGVQGQRREVCSFWIAFVVDLVESKACKSELMLF
jgi:hypothetical protein